MKKFRDFCSNLWFYIKNYFEIKRRDRAWKEENRKIEEQAKRILSNDFFEEDKPEW